MQLKNFFLEDKSEWRFYIILVCVVFAIVVFTNIIQAFYVVHIHEKQAYENYRDYATNSLEQFKDSTNEIMQGAMSLAVVLSLNTDINEEVRSGQAYVNSDVMRYVKDSMLMTSNVENVAFFNPDRKKIFTIESGYCDPNEYWEGMTQETLMELEEQKGIVRTEQLKSNTNKVFTLCFQSNLFYDSYIIIDLDFNEMQREFVKYAEKLGGELYIEGDSQILFQTNEKLFQNGEFRRIAEEPDDRDEIVEINGVKYSMVYAKSEFANMRYILLEEYDNIRENYILRSQLRLILIYAAILLAGLVVLYLSMKRSYKPMYKLQSVYRRLQDDKENEREKQQMMEFITAPAVSQKTAESAQMVAEKRLGETDKLHLVMVIIDQYAEFLNNYTSAERGAYKYAIENICMEVLSEHYKCMAVECGENSKLFLISGVENDEHVRELMKTCATYVKDSLDFSITVIIADKCGFDDLNDAYNELIELKNYRFVFSEGVIITAMPQEQVDEKLEKCVATIKTCAAEGNFTELSVLLDSYIQLLRKSESNEIVSRLINLFTAVYEVFINQPWRCGEISLHKMMRELLGAETEENVKHEFHRLFKQAEQAKTEFSDNKYQCLLESIYNCVDENWSEPSFCVDAMAQYLKYSSAYLSRIFKYMTGHSLSGFIVQRRLEESAKLLRDSDISVKEIFEKCGFSSSSYFSVLFKKQYGVIPSEYRRSFLEKQHIE